MEGDPRLRLETHRLYGLPISERDYDDYCRMHRDERVMATLGGVRSDSDTHDYMVRALCHWRDLGYRL